MNNKYILKKILTINPIICIPCLNFNSFSATIVFKTRRQLIIEEQKKKRGPPCDTTDDARPAISSVGQSLRDTSNSISD